MNKRDFFPPQLQNDELFQKFLETFDEFTTPIEKTYVDVVRKYYGEEDLPDEVIQEILKEFGLDAVGELLAVSPVIDKYSVLAYATSIAFLKGSKAGYFLVLDLLGFSYTAEAWHEQVPKATPHTFTIDVNIDASLVESPYLTFQKIKLFTKDYILPIIDPLGYSYFVPINDVGITLLGAAHPTYFVQMSEQTTVDQTYGPSGWIVEDENEQKWNIRINGLGELKAFPVSDGNIGTPIFIAPNGSRWTATVDTDGNIGTEQVLEYDESRVFWFFYDHQKVDWQIAIDNDGVFNFRVNTGQNALLTESLDFLTLENGTILSYD